MPENFVRVSKYPRGEEYYPEAVVSNLEIQAQFSKLKKSNSYALFKIQTQTTT